MYHTICSIHAPLLLVVVAVPSISVIIITIITIITITIITIIITIISIMWCLRSHFQQSTKQFRQEPSITRDGLYDKAIV